MTQIMTKDIKIRGDVMACSFILRNSQDGLCPMTSSLLFLWTDGCLRASIILGNEQVSIQRQILLGPSYRISSRPFCFSHVMRSADKSSPARFPSMSRRPGFAPCCNSRRMTSASGLQAHGQQKTDGCKSTLPGTGCVQGIGKTGIGSQYVRPTLRQQT